MIQQLYIFFKVFIACILAGAVGLEREIENKPAGLKTHMIVGGACALLVDLSFVTVDTFKDTFRDVVESDPIRVIQAIIIGLGFLGAGTVLKMSQEGSIKYLTTAATFLISAAIGIAVSLELYLLAVCVSVLFFTVNFFGGKLKRRFFGRKED